MAWLLMLSFTVAFYALFAAVTARRRVVQTRVDTVRMGRAAARTKPAANGPSWGQRAKTALTAISARYLVRGDRQLLANVQVKLQQAGNPLNMRPVEWVGFRFFVALIFFAIGTAFTVLEGGMRGVLLLAVLTMLGWMAPNVWLSHRAADRQRRIAKQLPSAMDLLTISVEAGLGFDQALAKVVQKLEGPLSEEFGRTIREIQMGSVRSDAMQRLGARSGVDALKSFVSAVVQADKLGTGLAQVLRVQSTSLREIHRVDAQERAMKAPVKMMFPLVLFVFPSVFIVVLGPAVIHVVQLFSKGGL